MSDDTSYISFLEKANADANCTPTDSPTENRRRYTTNSITASVPASLYGLPQTYVSDTDSPFEPVSLLWGPQKSLPNSEQLAELIGHKGEVEPVEESDFDPRGQYNDVLEKVKAAGDGKVAVFRVAHGGPRAEYYVVSMEGKKDRVVGVKTVAIES
ncbi:hypothetical protein EV356DRAFT_456396 [Viridothelium virens]|uniref:Uncharacterized protein n=1 Tax=Viridothelium virens TaxID=1048519 RepID=A0A6A6GU70_VIRVR|nr:hypothetical protein EV356DRAFT_456396 [Viridothelium virens]